MPRTTFHMLGSIIAASTMTNGRKGMPKAMSARRISTVSTQPPKKPEIRPTTVPTVTTATAAVRPTIKRTACAVDELGIDVAAEMGGAEDELVAGIDIAGELHLLGEQDLERLVGDQLVGEDRDQDEDRIERRGRLGRRGRARAAMRRGARSPRPAARGCGSGGRRSPPQALRPWVTLGSMAA